MGCDGPAVGGTFQMPVAKGAWVGRCCGLDAVGLVIYWGAWFARRYRFEGFPVGYIATLLMLP